VQWNPVSCDVSLSAWCNPFAYTHTHTLWVTELQVVVVGAHMDSLPTGDIAPGAVDNGSGTVALLVLAQEFAKHSWNRTIEFVAFGAEEQGIHGSAEYVQRAGTDGVDIVSALCMDMIACVGSRPPLSRPGRMRLGGGEAGYFVVYSTVL
jgi:Zn-dependent M28 family amino/carboxypeptidase